MWFRSVLEYLLFTSCPSCALVDLSTGTSSRPPLPLVRAQSDMALPLVSECASGVGPRRLQRLSSREIPLLESKPDWVRDLHDDHYKSVRKSKNVLCGIMIRTFGTGCVRARVLSQGSKSAACRAAHHSG